MHQQYLTNREGILAQKLILYLPRDWVENPKIAAPKNCFCWVLFRTNALIGRHIFTHLSFSKKIYYASKETSFVVIKWTKTHQCEGVNPKWILSDLAHCMLTYSLLLLNKNRKVGLKLFQFLRSPKNYVPDVPNIKTPHFTKLPDTIFCCTNTSDDGFLKKKDNVCMKLVLQICTRCCQCDFINMNARCSCYESILHRFTNGLI